ncbi:hypothetical protein M9X92_008509 [Pyricularia oryzae]|nr:hypothetical protein M9X92_008509 [Pyricularia oryzae]
MDKVGGRSAAVHSSIVMCRTPMDANLVPILFGEAGWLHSQNFDPATGPTLFALEIWTTASVCFALFDIIA